jgi:hypothetical protein
LDFGFGFCVYLFDLTHLVTLLCSYPKRCVWREYQRICVSYSKGMVGC